MSKLVEMLKICPCCKYVWNLYQTITFTSLLRINTYLANICICPHFSRQRKFNANLELQIYHIFASFANISKSVFSSSALNLKIELENLTVLKSYLKCWNADSDKTEFRCKDNIEISAVTGKIDQFTCTCKILFYL